MLFRSVKTDKRFFHYGAERRHRRTECDGYQTMDPAVRQDYFNAE